MPTGMWGRCTVAEPDLTAGGRTCFSWESRAAGRRSPVGRSDDSAHAIVWHVLPELAPLMLLLPNLRLKLTGLLLKESAVASPGAPRWGTALPCAGARSEEHTSELQSRLHLVCRLLLEKKKNKKEHTVIGIHPSHRGFHSDLALVVIYGA